MFGVVGYSEEEEVEVGHFVEEVVVGYLVVEGFEGD